MSWRFLLLTLLLAFGAAAFGGIQLGDWLVAHAPLVTTTTNLQGADPDQVVLDADGKPYLAQPPQPLVDGRLGVPDKPTQVAWDARRVSLLTVNTNPNVLVSARKLSTEELQHLQQASDKLPPGPADIVSADVPLPGAGSGTPEEAPRQAVTALPRPGSHWQQALRDALAQCAKLGFFDRPSCAWTARNRYCEPNHAWGEIHECPRRPG